MYIFGIRWTAFHNSKSCWCIGLSREWLSISRICCINYRKANRISNSSQFPVQITSTMRWICMPETVTELRLLSLPLSPIQLLCESDIWFLFRWQSFSYKQINKLNIYSDGWCTNSAEINSSVGFFHIVRWLGFFIYISDFLTFF